MEPGRIRRRERSYLARLLGVTLRTVEHWADARRPLASAPVGRPRIPLAERRRALRDVTAEYRRQGRGAGWRPLHAALGARVRQRLLQESLSRLKGALARKHRRAAIARRMSMRVCARDALWAQDATQVGRVDGRAVLAEVVRDAATTRTAGLAVGSAACVQDVIRLLDRTAQERGGPPLVHALDNGAPYRSRELRDWSEQRRVVLLHSVPHVPQHNAAVEHAHGELKQESGLASSLPLRDAHEARDRLERARARLDAARSRTSRGGLTAAQLDALLPRGDDLVSREVFYATACANVSRAMQNAISPRARRLAEREAILATMENFGLIHRTRGDRPLPAVKGESVL